MGFWKKHFSSKHLDSGDLNEGQKAAIKILAVGDSDEAEGDGEKKMLLTFKAAPDFEKQLIARSTSKPPKAKTTWECSKTIGYCLAAMFGEDDSAWLNKVIVVYVAKIRGGEAVRVWGSPHIDKELSVSVREFGGGKKTWTMRPTPMPQGQQQSQQPQQQQQSKPATCTGDHGGDPCAASNCYLRDPAQ